VPLTKRLDEQLRVARIILRVLRDGPLRWTPLMKAALRESPTPWKARSTLEWLLRHGYIERPQRGLYRITDGGRVLLDGLPQPTEHSPNGGSQPGPCGAHIDDKATE